MIGTMLLIALYQGLLGLHDRGYIALPGLAYPLLKALVFREFWAIIWQFRFNMRTDVYYIVANRLGCKNLSEDTQTLLRSLLGQALLRWPLPRNWKLRLARTDLKAIPSHEMRGIRLYLPFYVAGTAIVLGTFFLRTVPILWQFLIRSVGALADGWAANPGAFSDAVVFIALTALNYGWLGLLIWRNRQGGRTAHTASMHPEAQSVATH